MLALNLAFSRKTEEQEGRKKQNAQKLSTFHKQVPCSSKVSGPRHVSGHLALLSSSPLHSVTLSVFESLPWVTESVSFFFGTFKSENKMLHPRSSAGLCVPQCRQQSFTLVTTCASSSSKFISLPHRHGHGHKQHVLWKSTLQLRLYFICYI